MTQQPQQKPPVRVSLYGVFIDLMIDAVLIALGVALYYHFMIYPIVPGVDLSPVVTNLIGDKKIAIYLISGIPFVIGVLGLIRTLWRVIAAGASIGKKK